MPTRKVSFFILPDSPLPAPTLFPYTTLFRSNSRARRTLRGRYKLRLRPSALAGRWMPQGGELGEHGVPVRSEEHTSELQSRGHLVCRLLLEKKKGSLLGDRYSNPRVPARRAN